MADFDVKNLIGKGYFGEVHVSSPLFTLQNVRKTTVISNPFQLVSERHTGEVYAMKTMRKSIVTATQIREERDIMASRRSDWLTSLQYAFQVRQTGFILLVMKRGKAMAAGSGRCVLRRLFLFFLFFAGPRMPVPGDGVPSGG